MRNGVEIDHQYSRAIVREICKCLRTVLVEEPKLPSDLTHLLGRLHWIAEAREEDQSAVWVAGDSPREVSGGKFLNASTGWSRPWLFPREYGRGRNCC
jgi:hypothetical protein